MSARAKRVSPDRAIAVTKWQESLPQDVDERARFYAKRNGLCLRVWVLDDPAKNAMVIWALVTNDDRKRPQRWTIGRDSLQVLARQVAIAKRWAESEADRLASVAKAGAQ